ncbi:bifunctional NAD(P)H-dependent oxidoreductase/GNAT family N-acetyltransferase [Verrucosispora sp. WMMD1129]|uniref:bifunctional NAD(P)H-dependent oxidoreductase/GNAT family N-acetyltransferase n=1 Tax=Verrucosispora sp. WMMD1129 TaxID=3016093 RepID=UPI00249AC2BB|nr:bifunctional NAD(P)H-dependent oxidoreductase/GNAT family N-acetyltransferase [Verrucosispora sp. WMMD1129]WFE48188.1 bifunctional NAD(P)H-dependent oxidoreductase/GNAT family N-acetyltransferase [Verrucosispora sp. WMMD1129]
MSSNSSGDLRVLVITASTRPGRLGPAITDWFVRTVRPAAASDAITVDVADLADVALPLLDEPEHPASGSYRHEHTRRWSHTVAAADAFVVVTPEYNFGMPAALKNAFDFLYHEWAWKPVAFVSYGNTSAGTRSAQMAKQVVTTLRMMPVGATVALRIADTVHDGQVASSAALDEAARALLVELSRVARALRPLRGGTDPTAVDAPVTGLTLREAQAGDLAELLVLQRCCWVQEAIVNDTLDLAPLRETIDELRASLETWRWWCVRRDGRLVAAVRARAQERAWLIGRLMVAPDQAGNGIGSWLLSYAEGQAPEQTTHCTLFTGHRSVRNISRYERAGYTRTATGDIPPDSVRLSKPRSDDLAGAVQHGVPVV